MTQTTLTGGIISEDQEAYYELPFSWDYPKFRDRKFTTIRKKRIPKKHEGNYWQITVKLHPGAEICKIFLAKCLTISRVQIKDISDEILIRDTTTFVKPITSREAALAMLQQFYRKPIDEETEVSLIKLKRNFF